MLDEAASAALREELRALDDRISAALLAIAAPLDTESARRVVALALLASFELRPDRPRAPGWRKARLLTGAPPLWIYWLAERSLIHLFLRWGDAHEDALPNDPGLAWDALASGAGAKELASFSARRAALQAWAQTSPEELEEDVPLVSCDLCGTSQLDVEQLVQGSEISLCGACVASCARELAEAKNSPEPAESACALCEKAPAEMGRFVRRAGLSFCDACIEACAELAEPTET